MEKERFDLLDNGAIYDNKLKEYVSSPSITMIRLKHFMETLTDLLNQQDKEIEELKEKYNKLYECYKKQAQKDLETIYTYVNENQQLKEGKNQKCFECKCKQHDALLLANNAINELKQKAVIPLANIGDKLYMIPTKTNGLPYLNTYTLLEISISEIGVRYHLSACEPKKGIERLYAASPEMFGESIFKTFDEALLRLQELKKNAN